MSDSKEIVVRLKPSHIQELDKVLKQRRDYLVSSDQQQAKHFGLGLSENDMLLTFSVEDDKAPILNFKSVIMAFVVHPASS
jgi:hypothetical protein